MDATSGSTLNHLLSMIEKSLSLWPPPGKAEHYFIIDCLEHNALRMGNSLRLGGTWSIGKSEATDDPSLQYPVMSIHLVFVTAEELESSVSPFLLTFNRLLMGVSIPGALSPRWPYYQLIMQLWG